MVQVQWEGYGGDLVHLQAQLDRLLEQASGRAVLLMDSAGRLLTLAGDIPRFDVTAFVSLLAADFCATRELARVLDEDEFHSVFHEGRNLSLYMTQIVEGAILAMIYDRDTTLGLVRYAVRRMRSKLSQMVSAGLADEVVHAEQLGDEFGGEVLGRVDQLFDSRT